MFAMLTHRRLADGRHVRSIRRSLELSGAQCGQSKSGRVETSRSVLLHARRRSGTRAPRCNWLPSPTIRGQGCTTRAMAYSSLLLRCTPRSMKSARFPRATRRHVSSSRSHATMASRSSSASLSAKAHSWQQPLYSKDVMSPETPHRRHSFTIADHLLDLGQQNVVTTHRSISPFKSPPDTTKSVRSPGGRSMAWACGMDSHIFLPNSRPTLRSLPASLSASTSTRW